MADPHQQITGVIGKTSAGNVAHADMARLTSISSAFSVSQTAYSTNLRSVWRAPNVGP